MSEAEAVGLKVLAVGAHPDDVEFTCAGTLGLLARRGCTVAIATLSSGDLGSVEWPAPKTAEIRQREAANAAALLGASYRCLGFHDFGIYLDDEANRRVTELLRAVQPDLVFAPSPQDYMADHENTSVLVRNACFYASVPHYLTSTDPSQASPPMTRVPALYYCDPVEGKDLFGRAILPSLVVDVSETMEIKSRMLACHESQRNWLRRQHGVDQYIEEMKAWAAERGRLIGRPFGEGFRQHLGHAYPQEDILNRLLEGWVHKPQ